MDRAGTIARSLGHRHSYDDAALNAGANHYRCIRSGPSGSNAADTQLPSDCDRLVERKWRPARACSQRRTRAARRAADDGAPR